MARKRSLTYADAGVDIDEAERTTSRIKQYARRTFDDNLLAGIGAFGAAYDLKAAGFEHPVLVSSADGVGTKLMVAFGMDKHDTVGQDLVNHCVNDIAVQGARPLYFLDYFATGKLKAEVAAQVVKGLSKACRENGCSLIGGETAEMPDFYQEGEYDLAGFIVGMADESRVPGTARVRTGDLLVGLPSSGIHTNGYSLVRKLFFEQEKMSVDTCIESLGKTLGEELLIPHRNYLPSLCNLVGKEALHAVAHVTGGGITDNLARVLPSTLDARVRRSSWEKLPIFHLIQELGRVEEAEMYRTFNMGLGMILVVDRDGIGTVASELQRTGEKYVLVGEIGEGEGKVRYA